MWKSYGKAVCFLNSGVGSKAQRFGANRLHHCGLGFRLKIQDFIGYPPLFRARHRGFNGMIVPVRVVHKDGCADMRHHEMGLSGNTRCPALRT